MINDENQFVTRAEAAFLLGLSLRTFDRWRSLGKINIAVGKRGEAVKIPIESIEKILGHKVRIIMRSSL